MTAKKTIAKKPTKVVAKKKTVSKEIDWSKVKKGTWFTALILGYKCTGKIQKEDGDIYLCQNIKDGADCYNRLGFKFSWIISNGSKMQLKNHSVRNLKLLTSKPKSYKHIPIKQPETVAGYNITYHKGYIMVGCTKITNTHIRKIVSKLQ